MNTIHSAKDYYILYVDDEEKSLKYFSRYFSRDYRILTAVSTAEARAILDEKATEIGVLISDQRMPVEKGVELLKYSRENYPHIVRLLTTAYSDLNDAIEAVNRGEIMRYIPKPWDINFLELEIRQALRYFILNQEREQLRREKLSVIQRVMSFNRAKDLIILSAGMTQVRNAVLAIRACLLQLPENLQVTTGNSFNYDLQQMIKSEIEVILTLATTIQKDIISNNNMNFEPFNIMEKCKAVSETTPAGIKLIAQTDDVTIEANAVLMDKLLQILLEQICIRADNGVKHITISRVNSELQIHTHSGMQLNTLSLLNITAPLLCLYYICYHHGGIVQTENTTAGTDWKIHLPYRQTDTTTPELPSDWQDEIFQRYEVLPE